MNPPKESPLPGSPLVLRTIIDAVPDPIFAKDLEGRYVLTNRANCAMFGVPPEEFIGRTVFDIQGLKENAALYDADDRIVLATGTPVVNREEPFTFPDGRRGWFLTSKYPVRDANHAIIGLVGIARDISERREAQRKLAEDRRFLQTLIDAIPDLIFFKDRDGRHLHINAADRKLFGVHGEDAIGKTIHEWPVPADLASAYAADDEHVLSTGEPIINREEPFERPGGGRGTFLTTKLPMRDELGAVIGLVGIARDITERKAAERLQADEHTMLRTLIDAVLDPIFFKDCEGRLVLQNTAYAQMFNPAGQPYIGRTDFDFPGLREHANLYHADDLNVLSSGQPLLNREEPFQRHDGTDGWFLTSKFPLSNAAGEVIGLVGIARDISEFKRNREELERTRQRLLDHVDNSPLAVIEWRPDFRVERWSGRAGEIFGWHAAEVIGRHFNEWPFVHSDDAESVAQTVSNLIEGRERRNVSANRNITKSGSVVHCVWHNSVLRDAEGRVVSILSLVQDVTDRVEAEHFYRTLVEATDTGYVVLDASGRVIEANTEYVRLAGQESTAQIRGRNTLEWTALHDMERHLREISTCIETGSSRGVEIDYVHSSGHIQPVEVNARAIRTAAGLRIVALCRDISDRRRIAAEQREMERKLRDTQKLESLGVLAGGIAHDFNNLLTGILGNASLIACESPEDSPFRMYVEQIELAATRAADLCRQMLAYSGKGRFIVHPVDLGAIISETAELLRVSISKSTLLTLDLTAGLPALMADATQMRQVIMNLVINASEALGESGGVVRISTGMMHADHAYLARTRLSPDLRPGDFVFLEVADNGCGMTPEVLSCIFDPFFTTKFTGRGLGLAAVLGIIRGHHGALHVESEPGKGTTFRVLFPPVEGVAAHAHPSAPAAEWTGSGLVLVVDDEEHVRAAASRMLQFAGFTPRVALDGEDGVAQFASAPHSFRAILLDLTMPRMDGQETLRAIRSIHSATPVILMSGFTVQELVPRFAEQAPESFLQKPFGLEDLRAKLRSVLE